MQQQVYLKIAKREEIGQKQSDIIEEQKKRTLQLESRYNNRCIYLTCERETLYKRLDDRYIKNNIIKY